MERAMQSPVPIDRGLTTSDASGRNESSASGVSWAAVIAGALAAASLSLVLLALGAGLGLSAVSPWSGAGASAAAVGAAALVWLIVSQILASAMGGYLAGRLRTKWAAIHSDEVYFRDTAHGLLAWALGVVVTAALLTSAAAMMVGSAPAAVSRDAGTRAPASVSPSEYVTGLLFRGDRSLGAQDDAAARGEAQVVFANGLRHKALSSDDQTYLGQIVANKTGLDQATAEKRVSTVFVEAQQAADEARRAAAGLSLCLFFALLAGAFVASYTATIGGRQRDHVKAV